MFTYSFNEEHHLMLWKQAVELNVDLMTQWMAELDRIEKQRPPFNRFVNLAEVTGISLKLSDLRHIAEVRSAYTGPKVKSAFYCPEPLGFGIGRMYQAITMDRRIQVEVFMNLESCAHWLDVPKQVLEI